MTENNDRLANRKILILPNYCHLKLIVGFRNPEKSIVMEKMLFL